MPVQVIDLNQFEKNAENLYEAVVIASKRARQINDDIKVEISQRLEPILAKEIEDDTIMNEDKLNISLEFEKRDKPTIQAIKEILAGDIKYRYRDEK